MLNPIIKATFETLEMVFVSGLFSLIGGLPLGILLHLYAPNRLWSRKHLYRLLSLIVNATRSIPFIILMIAIIPFTRLMMGTSIGVHAVIVPLTLAAIPFFARTVETALNEIPDGLIEAAKSMGANHFQIISKVLIPESLPSIISGLTLTLVNLVGYSAMAGFNGSGGLGTLAINYGYQRYDTQIMIITVLILVILVQCIQTVGDYVSRKLLSH
ncbi:ABC transporter permease [Candidatus Berkiella cookevillensis]|uniref:ABC transporter permease n=1 Tax=Candidatus Berkiella cookevillensis TaxID=437022 RepID=A0A0Q9YHQ3_9GAMM|nr:methionine ABC transporter permease [Candidatus Berkiella cookevillensis]MCS5708236.1 ABC transporter permease [Candidatus Berkiella cookevillensis]